jgi:hypothetical protein
MGQRIGATLAFAVAGGLGSVAGGGKFANGAVTAAFGYLYNELGSYVQRGYQTFGYDNVTEKKVYPDGGSSWYTKWTLSEPAGSDGGWIVQEVTITGSSWWGLSEDKPLKYWELWYVKPGTKDTTVFASSRYADDLFGISGSPGGFGMSKAWSSSARYYEGLTSVDLA